MEIIMMGLRPQINIILVIAGHFIMVKIVAGQAVEAGVEAIINFVAKNLMKNGQKIVKVTLLKVQIHV